MAAVTEKFTIGGMTCVNCQTKIEGTLRAQSGVYRAAADYETGRGEVDYDPEVISFDRIEEIITGLGYEVPGDEDDGALVRVVSLTVIILSLYVLLQHFGVLNLLVPDRLADSGMGYGMLFVTGLVTSVHCVAMCGGIGLSQSISPRGISAIAPSALYNFGRVTSYTGIGALLGGVGYLIGGGSGAGVPVLLQGILKLIAGALMVVMGVNMLGLFPGLRKLTVRMPKGLAGLIGRGRVRSSRPYVVGLLNGLMPCGPLQSMQIIALASGNPLVGGLSMLMFSLGTTPLMLGLGTLVSALGKRFSRAVMNVGAVLVAVLGLAMLSQGGTLSGLITPGRLMYIVAFLAALGIALSVPIEGKKMQALKLVTCAVLIAGAAIGWRYVGGARAGSVDKARVSGGVQEVVSTLSPGEYPNIQVQEGIPVRWTIRAPEGSVNGCNYRMILREYGLEHDFEEGENVIEFTPAASGTVSYSCWMGMIHGNIYVTP